MDGSSRSTQSGDPRPQPGLACNICFRPMPNSPVAAYCGHVFCWPCLYQSWPQQQDPGVQAGPAITKSCPICGTALREGYNIVPIYGFDNVESLRTGTERPTTTGTTTTAAAAAPDTAAADAPVSNTLFPIPPRPTEASFFTATPRRPYPVAARARARAAAATAPNPAFPPLPAAVSSDTDIPPRPNPPAWITQTQSQTQTQTDRALAPPSARSLGPYRLGSLRNLASSPIPRQDSLSELFFSGAGRPALNVAAARNMGFGHAQLGVASRSARMRSNFRLLRHLRLNPPGMDGDGGNSSSESHQARMDRALNELLDDIVATVAALLDAREEHENALMADERSI